MVCCGDEKNDEVRGFKEERSCTDIPCCLLFIGFWAGYVAVASIGFSNGDPDRLLYGTDYMGYVCGKGSGPTGFSSFISATSPYQSQKWADNNLLWFPISANFTSGEFTLSDVLQQGVCVANCPQLTANTLNLLKNASFNFFNPNIASVLSALTVSTYGSTSRTGNVVYAPEKQYISYSTTSFYHRCIPDGLAPDQLNATLSKVAGFSGATNFFWRGIQEVSASWRVFLIIAFIVLVFCFVWTFLMRFLVKPLTVLAILLVLAVIVIGGYLMNKQADRLQNEEAGTAENDRYQMFYRVSSYIMWAFAGVYIILIIFLWKKIDEACSMIKISGRVIASSPTMLVVPPVIAICIMLVAAWALAVACYLYTADNLGVAVQKEVAVSRAYLGNSILNSTGKLDTRYVPPAFLVNVSAVGQSADESKRNLLFYDLFAFLWTMGFLGAIGYTLIAFCTVFWYFSDIDDSKKAVPAFGLVKALRWTLFYHLGTLAFGSCIIAVIQFVRIIMNYLVRHCESLKKNQAAKILICIADCCLAYFERVVAIIAKNAYIMMAIKSNSFLCAAKDAFNLIIDNAATIAILNFITEIVIGLGKVIAVLGGLCLSWSLLDSAAIAPGVQTKILPLILIGFMIYFICVVFFDVYSTTIDTNFVCYHHDLKINAAVGVYYFPKELENQMKHYDSEKKAKEYKAKQEAQARGEPFPAQPKAPTASR